MKENSISYKTAKQETERLICEIEEITITHRAYTAECLRRVLKENEELKEYKKIAELTKISCCTAQNCEALNNAIKSELENQKLKEELNDINQSWIQKVKDKIEEIDKIYNDIPEDEGNFAKAILIKEKQVLQELLEGKK